MARLMPSSGRSAPRLRFARSLPQKCYRAIPSQPTRAATICGYRFRPDETARNLPTMCDVTDWLSGPATHSAWLQKQRKLFVSRSASRRLDKEGTALLHANANSLTVGTYGPITVTFTNSDTGYGTTTVTATLTVNPPELEVTPATNIVSSGTQGGPFSPTSFRYTLSATYGSVKYSITTPSWLTASPEAPASTEVSGGSRNADGSNSHCTHY
jgi:hypothetical protein